MADLVSSPAFASVTPFVNGGASMTVASLIATFPPAADTLGMYARVSDLFGAVDDIMRCRWDGVAYRWIPQRPNYNGVSTATSGSVSIVPLVTPPTLRLTANLLGNLNIVPSSTNAFVGMQQRVVQEGTLGLFVSSITGLLGSNLTLLGNSTRTIEFNGTGWFAAG